MSIIKSGEIEVLRPVKALPLALWTQSSSSIPGPASDPLADALEAAQAELGVKSVQVETLSREIAEFSARLEQSFQDGERQGRKIGLEQAERRQEEALQRLGEGIQQALEVFGREMLELDRLAVVLSHEALSRILDDPGQYPDLLARIIRLQLKHIEAQSVLSIEVSADDFSGDSEISELVSAIGNRQLDVRIDPDRKSGECRIKLQLGGVEVGIGQQWGQLRQLLGDMAEPGGPQ